MGLFSGPGTEGGDRYLIVTTERLLLVGETQLRGGAGRIVQEVHIDQVSGLSCVIASGWMAGWALLQLVGKALVGLVLVILLSRISAFFWLVLVVWLWWLIGALMAQGKRVSVEVYAKNVSASPVSLSSQAKSGRFRGHYEAFDLPLSPGRDAEQMTAELGALVMDIQREPASAIEKWATAALGALRAEHQSLGTAQPVSQPQPNVVGQASD